MHWAWLALGAMLSGGIATAQAPAYNASSIVNASDFSAGPFAPGSLLTIFGTNLAFSTAGLTTDNVGSKPLPASGEIPQYAASIDGFGTGALQLLLNGSAIDQRTIAYAGLTPGFAGLYQINFYLPGDCPVNPQLQLAMGGRLSAAMVSLAVAAPPQ